MILLFAIAIFILTTIVCSPFVWIFSKNKLLSFIGKLITLGTLFLITSLFVLDLFNSRMTLTKDNIYGSYVINRNKCSGKQADWQYNHYRFKITEDNKIFFYITEKENIIKTIEGTVAFNGGHTSPQIKLDFEEPKFHVLQQNPTLYREIWTFYYVFESSKFGNMFFTKGNWKSID
jgi:hypothetical protein